MRRLPLFTLPCLALAACSHTHHGDPVKSLADPTAQRDSIVYSVERNLTYTPEHWPSTEVGDLYLPAARDRDASRRPAVLLIHGGGWEEPERRKDMKGIARKLASRGYVVFNVTYRLTPDWQFPDPVDDLRQAVRFLRQHADQWQIDPGRIGAFGYSAGGHLGALLGLMPGPPETRVQAIVAGGAPSDLTFYPGGDRVPAFIGGTLAEKRATFQKASPVNHFDSYDPPVFLYHARNDKLVPPEHPERFYAALGEAGVPRELFWLEGRNHVTGFLFATKAEAAAIAFLDRILGQ